MFVLTADQHASRRGPDLVPAMQERLGPGSGLRLTLDFMRTAGDEIQGLTDDPQSVIDACSLLLRDGQWSVGVGVGPVDTPLPRQANEGRGPAFVLAREAVEDAKRRYPPVRLLGATSAAGDADALLRLLATVWQKRTAAGWQAVAAMSRVLMSDTAGRGGTQALAASKLSITEQALGQRLQVAAYQPEQDVMPLLRRLLSAAVGGE